MGNYYSEINTYWLENRIKFFGILEGYNLYKVDLTLIQLLIDKNIYRKKNLPPDSFFGYLEGSEEYNHFGLELSLKPNVYRFNLDIYEEIFLLCYKYVEERSFITYPYSEWLEDKIALKMDKKSKRKFLKKQYKKWFPPEENFNLYSSIVDDRETFHEIQRAWYDMCCENCYEGGQGSFLHLYLTSSLKSDYYIKEIDDLIEIAMDNCSYFKEFIEEWIYFSIAEIRLNDILDLLKIVEKPNKQKKKSNKKKNIMLENLFSNKEKYDSIISDLITNNIITANFEINIPIKYKKRGAQFYYCSIINQLQNKGYLMFCEDVDLVQAMNNTFNINLTKHNYYTFLNSPKQEEYLLFTAFINKVAN